MSLREYRYSTFAQSRAKSLRRNMTPSERHLWYDFLKTYPVRFWKQRPIGPYIVDFLCYDAALIVELDGSSHDMEGQYDRDERRTHYLKNHGFPLPFPHPEAADTGKNAPT